MFHLAGISSGAEPASRTYWLGLPGSPGAPAKQGVNPRAGELRGCILLPGDPHTGAPQGG